MLDPFALLVQHCWGHTRPYTHDLQGRMGRIVPTIHCRSQPCWELLHPLHTTANTHATTHNIAGPTMLGVVRPFARRFTLLRRLGTSKLLAGLSQSEEKAASCHG